MKRTVFISLLAMIFVGLLIIAGLTQRAAGAVSGEQVFKEQCSACHAGGGNILNPKKPLKGSPPLKTFAAFLTQIRKPQQPMPPFPPSKISDEQAKQLYDYILKQEKAGWK
jgi:cytochrome c6